jgi:hypothetical protein
MVEIPVPNEYFFIDLNFENDITKEYKKSQN